MNHDEALKRIQELEEALRKEKAKSDEYKQTAYSLLNELYPSSPMTEEEATKLMTETDGRPILEIIEELERTGS
jgi:hypothetical protein